eukprot:comp18441_c0_seq1/m.19703 comp18441_c0_seq1/g.19703  ORF comp18441_c0_seq1/g.19703 comp18441_c0_seq1/m.19703 type:complete len:546 (+) comp18441_c0_seq1:59-1696(+)
MHRAIFITALASSVGQLSIIPHSVTHPKKNIHPVAQRTPTSYTVLFLFFFSNRSCVHTHMHNTWVHTDYFLSTFFFLVLFLSATPGRHWNFMEFQANLQAEEKAGGVLDGGLDVAQECHSLPAVNQAVVVGQRNVHHGPDLNLAVDSHGAVEDTVHAENSRLGGVDDGGAHEGAKDPPVGDGEGTAGHVFNGNLAVAGLLAQGGNCLLEISVVVVVAPTDHRHNQTLGGGNSHADVDGVTVDDLLAINDGIDDRLVLECRCRAGQESRHEAQLDTVGLEEVVLELVAQSHDVAHVDLVEGGQHGVCVLGILQALGNAQAHAVHLDPAFAICGGSGGRCSLGRGRGLWCRCSGLRCGGSRSLGGSSGGGLGLLLRSRGSGSRGLGLGGRSWGSRPGSGGGVELKEVLADLDRVTLVGKHLCDHTRSWRRHLDINLIGLEHAHDIVHVDIVTDLLSPLRDVTVCDGISQVGHGDDLLLKGSRGGAEVADGGDGHGHSNPGRHNGAAHGSSNMAGPPCGLAAGPGGSGNRQAPKRGSARTSQHFQLRA